MFSVRQKREISEAIQKILRETNHPELPKGEIQFQINILGAESWSFAYIKNNGSVVNPDVNIHNELTDIISNNVAQETTEKCSFKDCCMHAIVTTKAKGKTYHFCHQHKNLINNVLI